MKHAVISIALLLVGFDGFSQQNYPWYAFWNSDTTLVGFKDRDSVVMITPKFEGFGVAVKFDDIIAAVEYKDEIWNSYYLTKGGKIAGRDSLFVFDNTPDCESEGFIRYHDRNTDRIGMFNQDGNSVIPAIYNAITAVHNGMCVAMMGAEKVMDHGHSGDEGHFSWKGGKEMLIDTLNQVLIENFPYDDDLGLNTLEKCKVPSPDSNRQSFLARDGSYYSFIHFELEFANWLKSDFLRNINKERLIASCFETLTYEGMDDWKQADRKKFLDFNYDVISSGLREILQPRSDWFVTKNGLNPYLFSGADFDEYYDNCNQAKEWIYPVMSVIVNHRVNGEMSQDHYQFLRTKEGYRLICISMGKGVLK